MKSTINKAMPEFEIDIDIQGSHWTALIPGIETTTNQAITATLEGLLPHAQHIEISIVLADNNFIQELNKKYRNKDKPTNVLSFPQTDTDDLKMPAIMLGDIIITSEVIEQEAKDQNKDVKNHYTHMLVHGCLHLLHYDHTTDAQAKEMEALEIKILNNLGIKNPYAL
jgi:probable rRNA maturation factor